MKQLTPETATTFEHFDCISDLLKVTHPNMNEFLAGIMSRSYLARAQAYLRVHNMNTIRPTPAEPEPRFPRDPLARRNNVILYTPESPVTAYGPYRGPYLSSHAVQCTLIGARSKYALALIPGTSRRQRCTHLLSSLTQAGGRGAKTHPSQGLLRVTCTHGTTLSTKGRHDKLNCSCNRYARALSHVACHGPKAATRRSL